MCDKQIDILSLIVEEGVLVSDAEQGKATLRKVA